MNRHKTHAPDSEGRPLCGTKYGHAVKPGAERYATCGHCRKRLDATSGGRA